MEKKSKLSKVAVDAGKMTKKVLNGVIRLADQNDDGKFDMADISVIAGTVGSKVKAGAHKIKDSADEMARLHELKILQPIFADTLDSGDFLITKLIRVVPRDKKHTESEVCQGSVGYGSDYQGLRVVNIFTDSIEMFGLSFYPDCDSEFYYVDPSDRDRYIALDEYFGYLKIARVNELKKLAQDLGAKYFKVTYKEEQTQFTSNKVKVQASTGKNKMDGKHENAEKKFTTVDVEAEMSFLGHAPIKPKLKYLQRDPSIQMLITMRMNEDAPLKHEKYMLKMSNSSGLKESDAVKIDAMLKGMKLAGNTTVASEAKNEMRRYLEYEIEF